MPPAARLTDTTGHAMPLAPGTGSPNIMIGFLPAWRALPTGMGAGLQAAQQAANIALQVIEKATLTAAAAVPPVALPAAITAESAARASTAASIGSMLQSAAKGAGADIHMCSMPYVPIPPTPAPPGAPHGPGVVIDGSATVMLNNLPAARMGDHILEALGPINMIAKGEMTVMIGP
jgi:uncharacterized Zn-binding protein involved in type VI secretion